MDSIFSGMRPVLIHFLKLVKIFAFSLAFQKTAIINLSISSCFLLYNMWQRRSKAASEYCLSDTIIALPEGLRSQGNVNRCFDGSMERSQWHRGGESLYAELDSELLGSSAAKLHEKVHFTKVVCGRGNHPHPHQHSNWQASKSVSLSGRCRVVFHCGFSLHFPNNQ